MSLWPTALNPDLYRYLLSASLREPILCYSLRKEAAKQDKKNHHMQISPDEGQFLAFLLQLISATHCLEIGTYMGYSALWLALHLPEKGQLITCDISNQWHGLARKYWQQANVDAKISFRLGPAQQSLEALLANDTNRAGFDFAFIDADKEGYLDYYETCLQLIRPGGLIAFDNVLWGGDVARPERQSPSTQGLRRLNAHLLQDQRVDLTIVPIGDGVSLVRKR